MFLNTVSLFLVSNIVQRPEEVINPIIGIRSHIAYSSDMKKAFYLRKPMQVLLARIVNYPSLLTILGNDACNSLMKQISEEMKAAFRSKHNSADLFCFPKAVYLCRSAHPPVRREIWIYFARIVYHRRGKEWHHKQSPDKVIQKFFLSTNRCFPYLFQSFLQLLYLR